MKTVKEKQAPAKAKARRDLEAIIEREISSQLTRFRREHNEIKAAIRASSQRSRDLKALISDCMRLLATLRGEK